MEARGDGSLVGAGEAERCEGELLRCILLSQPGDRPLSLDWA